MARFTRAELESYRDTTVPDLVGDSPRLVIVGINPGLWTAATQTHFARPGNRFWPAMTASGLLDFEVSWSDGLDEHQREAVADRGLAITNLVARATARADELSAGEMREGASVLKEKLLRWRPRATVVLGITAYRTAFAVPKAQRGRQPDDLAGAPLFVLGNPSGLNAHQTPAALAAGLREAGEIAGVL